MDKTAILAVVIGSALAKPETRQHFANSSWIEFLVVSAIIMSVFWLFLREKPSVAAGDANSEKPPNKLAFFIGQSLGRIWSGLRRGA